MAIRKLLVFAVSIVLAACQMPGREIPDEENEAPVAVKRFVVAHREVLRELRDVKQTSQATLATAQRTLSLLEEMSRRHGTGEITVFFPVGSARLDGRERDRLVQFADFLAREARGRKVLLVSMGSASAFGDQRFNLRLAEKRADEGT